MKNWYIFIIACIILTACKKQENPLREILLEEKEWWYDSDYFPLHMSLYGELEKDTIHVIVSDVGLAEDIDINIIPYEIFPELLYNEIVKNKGVINVKKNTYEWYRTHSIIEKNHIVDSIYADKGISGLLDYAIDDNGKLIRNGKEGNYIIYLCYQHNIYFFSEYNGMYTYVNAKTIKKNISLFNQSTKIKRYYQTIINGEYTK